MKITKSQLKQIIKEELEVTLTNEEATEMFGESVGTQLEEQELNEVDMSQVQIIMDAFAQIGINLSGAAAIGLMGYAMKTAIDLGKGEHSFSKRKGGGWAKPEEPLDEGLEALAADLDPQKTAMMVEALLQIGYTFAAPMLAAFLARIGYEAGATIWQGPLKRKDKNWLVNFIYDEVTGYQDHKGPAPKGPKGPPPGTVIPMGKDINRDYLDEEAKVAGDVARAGAKLGKASGIEAALGNINTRSEFEQMMMQFIQMVSATKLKPQDVKIGIRNVAKQVLQSK